MQHSTRYVVIDKYCEITGDTPQAVWSRIKNGYWLKGREVLTLSGMKTLIDLEEYERWVEMAKASKQPVQHQFKSASAIKVCNCRKYTSRCV